MQVFTSQICHSESEPALLIVTAKRENVMAFKQGNADRWHPQSRLRNAAIVIQDERINAILPRVYSKNFYMRAIYVYDTSQTDRTSD
jgi:hypothetical protein